MEQVVRAGDGVRSLGGWRARVEHTLLSDPQELRELGHLYASPIGHCLEGRKRVLIPCNFRCALKVQKPPCWTDKATRQRTAGAGSGVSSVSSGSPSPDVDKLEPTVFKETSGIGPAPLTDFLLCARDFYIYPTLSLCIAIWFFHPINSSVLYCFQVPWGERRRDSFINCRAPPQPYRPHTKPFAASSAHLPTSLHPTANHVASVSHPTSQFPHPKKKKKKEAIVEI